MFSRNTSNVNKKALIVTYAEVSNDPRVRNQIKWLVESGYETSLLGRGLPPTTITGDYWEIKRWFLPIRLFAYLFLPNQIQFNLLVRFWIRKLFHTSSSFDLVLVNTIDLLPWITSQEFNVMKNEGQIILDLHEYSPSQGTGVIWALLFKNYQNWLITFIASPIVTKRITVAQGIARLYEENFRVPKPEVILNVPDYEDLDVQNTLDNKIKLIHHGKADNARGLPLLIDAMAKIDNRFSLTFMLVGSKQDIYKLHKKVESLNLVNRINFRSQ